MQFEIHWDTCDSIKIINMVLYEFSISQTPTQKRTQADLESTFAVIPVTDSILDSRGRCRLHAGYQHGLVPTTAFVPPDEGARFQELFGDTIFPELSEADLRQSKGRPPTTNDLLLHHQNYLDPEDRFDVAPPSRPDYGGIIILLLSVISRPQAYLLIII